jgi:hypothetical protein
MSVKHKLYGATGFSLSKLFLQVSIFFHFHVVTTYYSTSAAKNWIDAFALASILTILLSGERHLSLKLKNENLLKDFELNEYIDFSTFISIVFGVMAIFIPTGFFWGSLFAIVSCEIIYSDQLRVYLINREFKKTIALNLIRSVAHLSIASIVIFPQSFDSLNYSSFPYILIAITLVVNSFRKKFKYHYFSHVLNNLLKYNFGFTSSAVISRAPLVADKLIINNKLAIDDAANYTIISGAASAIVGVIDNLYFQPKLRAIIASDADLLKSIKIYIKYLFSTSIWFALMGFIGIAYEGHVSVIFLIPFSMILLVLAYLNLMMHAYVHTLTKRYNLISINAAGSISLLYFFSQFYGGSLLAFSAVYLLIIACLTKLIHNIFFDRSNG